ncbi:metalloprotease 1 [Cordyceps fumosorosea ARSEF 2679]|uniref:Metalloprotease 1 n=1 Tax=Cordyceps fumosorosea (strain ARSEF 2679) TaxID=1081104 RepID=A0A162MVJ4_CORFA|nr:metalloprotease 1 [Cordyceps fumosorosea ARSEF 2679]OAA71219.1 metalloprotease 1 [Cordyceps fumosorosea ARSEF 2679]
MQLKSILLSLAAAATCQAAAVVNHEICGTPPPSEAYLQAIRESAAEEAAAVANANVKRDVRYIKTYVHIIASDSSRSGGNINDDTVASQIKVLNSDFQYSGYQFTLQNISRTIDSSWSDIWSNADLRSLKRSLRNGDYADLNIYYFRRITAPNRNHLTGFCTYPGVISTWDDFYNDGCCLDVETTPGGSFKPYNLGKITSHEVGHWFGLIHPWGNNNTGGCTNGNDLVDDTAPQDYAVYGCNEQSHTCSSSPYYDPVHNIMGYSDNSCVNQFTQGQYARMYSQFDKYRTVH